jgi:hypothetical protein
VKQEDIEKYDTRELHISPYPAEEEHVIPDMGETNAFCGYKRKVVFGYTQLDLMCSLYDHADSGNFHQHIVNPKIGEQIVIHFATCEDTAEVAITPPYSQEPQLAHVLTPVQLSE